MKILGVAASVGAFTLLVCLCIFAVNRQHPENCTCVKCDDSNPWDVGDWI